MARRISVASIADAPAAVAAFPEETSESKVALFV